jgi:hypothetical protein
MARTYLVFGDIEGKLDIAAPELPLKRDMGAIRRRYNRAVLLHKLAQEFFILSPPDAEFSNGSVLWVEQAAWRSSWAALILVSG